MEQSTQLQAPRIGSNSHDGAYGKRNDDYYDNFTIKSDSAPHNVYVAAVADGVGSRAAGYQASRIAVETVQNTLEQPNTQSLSDRLQESFKKANQAILEQSQEDPELSGMSTTLAVAAVDGDQLHVVHLGDSRVYLIREQQIFLLTRDHTWVEEAVKAGRISRDEANRHPNRHVIQRYLGIDSEIVGDHEIIEPKPESNQLVDSVVIQLDDAILLCTDGLTKSVPDENIQRTVSENLHSPQKAVNELLQQAVHAKEPDNITAVLMTFPDKEVAPSFKPQRLLFGTLVFISVLFIIMSFILSDNWGPSVAFNREPTATLTPTLTVTTTATPTATASHTPKPTPTPSATTLPTTTLIAIIEPFLRLGPTSTLVPNFTATDTPTPTDTATSTPSSTPMASPTRTPTSISSEESIGAGATVTLPDSYRVELVEPLDRVLKGKTIFRWLSDIELDSGQAFEVVVWQEGQDPFVDSLGIREPTTFESTRVDLDIVTRAIDLMPQTDYKWGLLLVEVIPQYKRLRYLGGAHLFRLESESSNSTRPTATASVRSGDR